MFGSPRNGANAYAKVGIETGVTAASPHALTMMLYEGALISVSSALQFMRARDIPQKGAAISKAIMIIDSGLRASLNKEAGGEIATNLDSLYQYMSNQLLMANLKNQPELLEEVYRLLKDLKDAWAAIGNTAQAAAAPALDAAPVAAARDPLAPKVSTLMKA